MSVFWSKCSDPLLFSQGSAAPTLLFLWAGQGSSLAAFRQGSAAFLAFSGQQARWRCQVGGRHLPTVSYGQPLQQPYFVTGFSESTVFAPLDRIVSRHILPGSLTSNSCSAAHTCVFVLRDEFAFSFQIFSRSDPPGKAALARGRYVFQKKGGKKKKKKEKK